MAQSDADFEPRRYRVRHRTTYTYDDDVVSCYERGFLRPRPTPEQTIVSHSVGIAPEPDVTSEHADWFGNLSSYVEIRTPHTVLDITKTSVVDVDRPRPDLGLLDQWTVASAGYALAREHPLTRATYLLPSPQVGDVAPVVDLARSVLSPDQPLGEALLALTHAIHDGFRFSPGATTVRTTLAELLEIRAGVCQDFTHLTLGCLRAMGLPARYVSGYIETFPPPGKPKMQGSDASHAWASVPLPDGTWIDLDPTNDQVADSRYVVTACGRDFRDVSPLKGVVFTESGSSTLDVAVDVDRIDPDDPTADPGAEVSGAP